MAKPKAKPVVEVKNLHKSFKVGKEQVPVLKGINLEVYFGEFVIIFGPSGCGKSTLLNTILGLEKPTDGAVLIRGQNVYDMTEDERALYRLTHFGVVYQQPNWVKSLNVIENVAFPLDVVGIKHRKNIKRALNTLGLFRLEQFQKYNPSELSGGQQQKLSVCRALISNPWIVLADEPTGNLDTASAGDLMYDMKSLNSESLRTIIMVTHNPDYKIYATKEVHMEDGKIIKIVDKMKEKTSKKEVISDILETEVS